MRSQRLARTSTPDFIARGEGMGLTVSQWVTAVLYNGLARYEDAFAAAAEATADPHELWFSTFATVELIEAASRSGRSERAAEALEVLSESTRAGGTPWALGVEARSRALLNRGEAAETLYREAIDRLQPTRLRLDLARAHLLYGEWLRRERRRLDARNQLRVAHDLFSDFGMEAFAERARVELQATGERARKRTVDTLDQLTPQEAQISRLAAHGTHQPRDRRSALHQPEHRRVPPAQGVPQARREVTHAACAAAAVARDARKNDRGADSSAESTSSGGLIRVGESKNRAAPCVRRSSEAGGSPSARGWLPSGGHASLRLSPPE